MGPPSHTGESFRHCAFPSSREEHMKFYLLNEVEPSRSRFTGEYNASHRWGLPGIHCPLCDATWGNGSDAYPCVDLSGLAEQEKFSARVEEDYEEFEHLCALVRPLVPAGV